MNASSASQEHTHSEKMKAVRVHQFGGLDAMKLEQVSRPLPGRGQVLIRVKAAGVGPWDAWVRAGKSAILQPLPLILGSDLAGVVEETGTDVSEFRTGEQVFGVTNATFTGAYAEYALVEVGMIANKPLRLSYIEAASVPVVATTAWQMVYDHGQLDATKRALIHGGAGNVGAYVVQFAKRAGAEVIATALKQDVDYVRSLGVDQVIDGQTARFEEMVQAVDVVLDTVGGETLDRSFDVLKPGGLLVSSITLPDKEKAARQGIRGVFFLVSVTTGTLTRIAEMFDTGQLKTHVGDILPLVEARLAHEMLAGKPHKPGKIVLLVDGDYSEE